ncbi:MAG: hypothetical protein A3G43_05555 [Ignavibacteria bacterium RIFCSPLOWO2_12_FULL_56_21]|nr:MAG: hypothetical protein A3G43_05555 [Ignavibacteria bacterium RIFCSPLOWO2_12_FULL_56_21]
MFNSLIPYSHNQEFQVPSSLFSPFSPSTSLGVNFFLAPVSSSKHPIHVGACLRHRLSDIPHFDNTTGVKAKDVDGGYTWRARLQPNERVDRHQVSVFEHPLDIEKFVGELRMILFHRFFQARSVAGKGRVMVMHVRVYKLRIRFTDIPLNYELQEGHCGILL